jgi:threonine/homoserine/homoserine lactone efflux protein
MSHQQGGDPQMQLAFIFATSFLIALSGALMPGPMLAVTIKESLEQGWPAGVFISIGHGLAEIALLIVFALGMSKVLQAQWITAVVGTVGGLVLLLMGIDMMSSVLRGKIGQITLSDQGEQVFAGKISTTSFKRALGAGIVVSVANPTWIIWWLTIGVMYVTQAMKYGWLGLGFFYTGHILAVFTWYVFIAFIVATGKRFLTPATYNWIMAGCGLLMVLLALFFLVQGIQAVL